MVVLTQSSEIFDQVTDFADRQVLRHLRHRRRRGGLFVNVAAIDANCPVLWGDQRQGLLVFGFDLTGDDFATVENDRDRAEAFGDLCVG